MNANYVNAFINGAVDVFEKELKIKLTRRSVALKNSPEPSYSISVMFGFTGFIKGQVVFSMGRDFSREITKEYLQINGLPAQVDKMIKSAMGELANMISGKASILLAGSDKILDLTPPSVITGDSIEVNFLKVQTITMLLDSDFGTLEINIAFSDNIKKL